MSVTNNNACLLDCSVLCLLDCSVLWSCVTACSWLIFAITYYPCWYYQTYYHSWCYYFSIIHTLITITLQSLLGIHYSHLTKPLPTVENTRMHPGAEVISKSKVLLWFWSHVVSVVCTPKTHQRQAQHLPPEKPREFFIDRSAMLDAWFMHPTWQWHVHSCVFAKLPAWHNNSSNRCIFGLIELSIYKPLLEHQNEQNHTQHILGICLVHLSHLETMLLEAVRSWHAHNTQTLLTTTMNGNIRCCLQTLNDTVNVKTCSRLC